MSPQNAPYALVVDDDALVLIVSCTMIEEAGFRPLEASDVKEALEVLEKLGDKVVLLFTDVEMPGGADGFHLAREVARRWPEIAIVVASGRVAPDPGDMPEKATFLSKPFSSSVVHEHLRHFLPDGKRPAALDSDA